MANKVTSAEQRFWKKVKKIDKDLCWIWTGSLYYNGYGQFYERPNKVCAHRFSYELHYGKIKDKNLLVCHKCDVRNCVNPHHLFLGTQSDNLKDMVKKGRNNCWDSSGQNNGRSLVTEKDVIKMRELRVKQNLTYKELGNMFGVSETQATRIVKKESWRKV